MAVVFKKKESSTPLMLESPAEELSSPKEAETTTTTEEELTPRQLEALEAVGLAPKKVGVTIIKKPTKPLLAEEFPMGALVRVTNDLWNWMPHYRVGDIGKIIKTWSLVPEAKGDIKLKLYEVEMTPARDKTRPTALIKHWELERYNPPTAA